MRSRDIRAVALARQRDWRSATILAMLLASIIALGLSLGDVMAAGSGNRPTTSSPDTPRKSDRTKPQKDPVTSSDDYEDAVDLLESQKYREAIAKLEKLNTKHPKHADVLNYLGYCHRKLGELDKAMDFYRQALAVNSQHRGVHEYLGELFLQKNDLKKAENELATLALLCPDGCEEHSDLKKAIDKYKAGSAAVSPASSE